MRPILHHHGLSLVCAALFLGCGASPGVKAPKFPSPPVDATLVEMVDRLGDEAAAVVVVDPRELSSVVDFLMAHGALFGPPGQVLMSRLGDPEASFREMAAAMGAPDLIDHLDVQRPIVLGLFQPVLDGNPGLGAQMSPVGQVPVPGIRHEALIPAEDAAALRKTLETLLDTVGNRQGDRWTQGEFTAALREEGDMVRVMLLTHHFRPLAAAAELPALWPTSRQTPARTPALARLTSGDVPLAALIRPWRVRGVATAHGIHSTIEALRSVPAEMRQMITAAGLGLVLSGEALMLASRPEYDDHAVAVHLGARGITLDLVSSLTPIGRDIHRAASKNTVQYPLKMEVPAQGLLGVNLGPALAAAKPRPELVARGKENHAMAGAFQECGLGCVWHTFTRVPWSTLAALFSTKKDGAKVVSMAHSAQVALLRPEDQKKDIFGGLVAVLQVSPEFEMDAFPPLRLLNREMSLAVETVGDRRLLFIKSSVDPKTVFDLERPQAAEHTLSLDLEESFFRLIRLTSPLRTRFLDTLNPSVHIDARLATDGRSFNLRLDLASRPGAPPPLTESHGLQWGTPIIGYQKSPGDTCLLAAFAETRTAFSAVTRAPADQRRTLFNRALAAMKPQLECAAKYPATAKAAAGLEAQLAAITKAADPAPLPNAPDGP